MIENIDFNSQLAEVRNEKQKQFIRDRILPDINNLASIKIQSLDILEQKGKISSFNRNYLSNQISRKAQKFQDVTLRTMDSFNNDNVEVIATACYISIFRNWLNACFLIQLGNANEQVKQEYMEAKNIIQSNDHTSSN